MKAIHVASAAVLLLAGCHQEDTGGANLWRRAVEPRLSTTREWHECLPQLSPGHVVSEARCAAVTPLAGRCERVVNSRDEADALLVARPQCTNVAIASLERFSVSDAEAMNDLAAAYYVRSQRNDDPEDLLRAFDAEQRAVVLEPLPRGAYFNLGLILEALSLNAEAVAAWQRAATTEQGEWAEFARKRHDALVHRMADDGERQWAIAKTALDRALNTGDASAVARVVAAFPATTAKSFEVDELRSQNVARVTTLAAALSHFFHDRYFVDVAAGVTREDFRQGLIRMAEARVPELSGDFDKAAPLYADAVRLLRGSPLSLAARIGFVAQHALQTKDYDAALQALDAIAVDAAPYPSVVARTKLNRLFLDQFADRYDDYFATYESVRSDFRRIGDWEDLASTSLQGIPTMSVVGLKKAAWREAFAAMRDQTRVTTARSRYLLVGETATAALDLGHAEAALLYQMIPLDPARTPTPYLVSVLDHLAAIEVKLQRYDDARRHLDEANRLSAKQSPGLHAALEARLVEGEGELALQVDPNRAVPIFTRAIGLASRSEFSTFRSSLLAERAEAYQKIGDPQSASADRRAALDALHAEEEKLLSARTPGHAEDLWNAYFSRFDDTYALLIRELIAEQRIDEAFQFAERARAFEPLDLVRNSPSAPSAFRDLAAHADAVDIAKLQAQMPARTVLIEFRVFNDATYVWLLGRDVFRGLWVPARRDEVVRWTAALQDAAAENDSDAFESGVVAPYDRLLKPALDVIRRLPGGATANLVIVPDRDLRGLPFAALRDPDTKRYVIQDHVVSNAGSALLYAYALLRDRDLQSRDASALLIGDPSFDPQSTLARGLARLPRARREVADISRLYPQSTVLIDTAATAQEFLRLAGRNAVIHIAAHGIVNGVAPSQSFLLFNRIVTAQLLMNDLHTSKTRLVVLGACSSAGGLPVGAEGIAPLVRPIIGAGVPGVIGALWDIDDATAQPLLVSFHRHYRQGSDAATALREAQLEMLRNDDPALRSGRFWAPFQAIGYASSPFAPIGDITKEKPP